MTERTDGFEIVNLAGLTMAYIIRYRFSDHGVRFLTPNSYSQQVAYMKHPSGKIIEAHEHNPVPREVYYTQEVLFMKKGRLRVDFYDKSRSYLESRVLHTGDAILLVGGAHGFYALDEIEMIEVKQGPYAGEADKTRFASADPCTIVIKGEN